MDGLVSVIIPAYNRQEVIEVCVASVLGQTYQNFEIIIVDDGSTDDTWDVCRKLADGDSRFVVLAMEHAGVSAARNLALENANGEYVFFLDSDDVIHPGLLGALVEGMDKTGAAVGGTEVVGVAQKNWHRVRQKLSQPYQPGETKYYSHEETLKEVFSRISPLNLIGGVMIRRDYIAKTRFCTDLFIGEDFYFVYENLIKGTGAVFLEQKWYYSRHHANNTSWNYSYEGFWTRFLRRKWVWETEESFGRMEYARSQKQQALAIFLMCIQKNPVRSPESKKMRDVMRRHKNVLFTGFSVKDKVKYYIAVYFPAGFICFKKIKKRITQ